MDVLCEPGRCHVHVFGLHYGEWNLSRLCVECESLSVARQSHLTGKIPPSLPLARRVGSRREGDVVFL